MISPSPATVERFRTLIRRRMGLDFEDAKLTFLSEVLAERLGVSNLLAPAYLDRFEGLAARDEIAALARVLTVPETYFFRNIAQFHALEQAALPARMRARRGDKRLSLLSAGCASGEEPYSLAISLRESICDSDWQATIVGVDINPSALAKARAARYSSWAMRETPEPVRRRWFRGNGRDIELDEGVKESVRFEERNLVEDDSELWAPNQYDVVFCRNMLMYLDPTRSLEVVGRITRALSPGGFLFLGHAESLRGLTHEYQLRQTHGTFYYQKQAAGSFHSTDYVPHAITPPLLSDWESTWIETVQRASERIQDLSLRSAPAAATTPIRANAELGAVLALMARERFHEALSVLSELPRENATDPDVLLLRAVLLTHKGKTEDAERVCNELLELDGLNSGAQYVLALCREGAHDITGAVERDRAAAYLDPTFAMPHVHMGLMARRAGDRATAERELGEAIPLLQREDASRLLLFGGGFTRDTLIGLCRAELVRSGDRT